MGIKQNSVQADRGTDNRIACRQIDEQTTEYRAGFVCLFGFLTSSSATRLYRGWVSRLTSDNFTPHMRQSGEIMASVSAGHYTTEKGGGRGDERETERQNYQRNVYR